MRNAWIFKKKEDRTPEDVLAYYRQLSLELDTTFIPPTAEQPHPKFDVNDLFTKEVQLEANKLKLTQDISSLKFEITQLEMDIIPRKRKRIEVLGELLNNL